MVSSSSSLGLLCLLPAAWIVLQLPLGVAVRLRTGLALNNNASQTTLLSKCHEWGTYCTDHYDLVRGRAALAQSCNSDKNCRGIWWIAGESQGYKCGEDFEKKTGKPSDNRFCSKGFGGAVSTWDTGDELKEILDSGRNLIELAQKTTVFLEKMSTTKLVVDKLESLGYAGSKALSCLNCAAKSGQRLGQALKVLDAVSGAAALASLIPGVDSQEDMVNAKLDKIDEDISELRHQVSKGFDNVESMIATSNEFMLYAVPAQQTLDNLASHMGLKDILNQSDVKPMLKELVKLQNSIMGEGTRTPLFDLYYQQIELRFPTDNPKDDPAQMLEDLMGIQAKFNEHIAIQLQTANKLGSMVKPKEGDDEEQEALRVQYMKYITVILENVRLQQERNDPMLMEGIQPSLKYAFAGDFPVQLCRAGAVAGWYEISDSAETREKGSRQLQYADNLLKLKAASETMYNEVEAWNLAHICYQQAKTMSCQEKKGHVAECDQHWQRYLPMKDWLIDQRRVLSHARWPKYLDMATKYALAAKHLEDADSRTFQFSLWGTDVKGELAKTKEYCDQGAEIDRVLRGSLF